MEAEAGFGGVGGPVGACGFGEFGEDDAVGGFDGAEAFDDLHVGGGQGEVEVDELVGVGGDGDVEGVGEVGDFHPLGDTADAADVGLGDVGGSAAEQVFESVFGVFVFAGGDGDGEGGGDAGEAVDVVGEDGLLVPADAVFLEAAAEADGLLGGVAVVGVDVELDVVAEFAADGGDAAEVGFGLGAEVHADFHLDAGHAALDVGELLVDELAVGVGGPTAAAVDRGRSAAGAEQLVEGEAQGLGLEVPEGDVDGRDGLEGEALAAEAADAPEHVLPEALDVEGIGAEQGVLEVVLDDGPQGSRGRGHSEAFDAFIGAEVDEAVAAGGHLEGGGVGDGRVAGDDEEGGLDVGDFHGVAPVRSPASNVMGRAGAGLADGWVFSAAEIRVGTGGVAAR